MAAVDRRSYRGLDLPLPLIPGSPRSSSPHLHETTEPAPSDSLTLSHLLNYLNLWNASPSPTPTSPSWVRLSPRSNQQSRRSSPRDCKLSMSRRTSRISRRDMSISMMKSVMMNIRSVYSNMQLIRFQAPRYKPYSPTVSISAAEEWEKRLMEDPKVHRRPFG